MSVKLLSSEFLLSAEKRFNWKGRNADLSFTIDRHLPMPANKWWGYVYFKFMSDIAYFSLNVYPFSLCLWRYDNI